MMISKIAGFDWDKGNWPKCGKHGVSKEEIESVFAGAPLVFPDEGHSKAEERFKAIGTNDAKRSIFINFTLRQNEDNQTLIRPISARYMHKEEVSNYERS